MDLDSLKKLVEDMELMFAFDNVEAERCGVCCNLGNGGC